LPGISELLLGTEFMSRRVRSLNFVTVHLTHRDYHAVIDYRNARLSPSDLQMRANHAVDMGLRDLGKTLGLESFNSFTSATFWAKIQVDPFFKGENLGCVNRYANEACTHIELLISDSQWIDRNCSHTFSRLQKVLGQCSLGGWMSAREMLLGHLKLSVSGALKVMGRMCEHEGMEGSLEVINFYVGNFTGAELDAVLSENPSTCVNLRNLLSPELSGVVRLLSTKFCITEWLNNWRHMGYAEFSLAFTERFGAVMYNMLGAGADIMKWCRY